TKLIEWGAWPRKERKEFVGRVGANAVGEFALSAADVPDAQLPRHVDLRPSGWRDGAVVKPAAMWAGEQPWYSLSERPKHHAGMSTLSIGALTVAMKLESII